MTEEELAKDLGLLSALTIGIGTMIGAGIFVLPGVAASTAGSIVVVSFVIGGLIAMVNTLSVSELGTAMPKAGGYYYVNRALGPLFGSIAGLGDWMGLAFASASTASASGSISRHCSRSPVSSSSRTSRWARWSPASSSSG
jgi:amino acid transporter